MDTEKPIKLKCCPFCGHPGSHRLTKIKHCQLHGEPYQDFIIGCFNNNCTVQPRLIAPSLEVGAPKWNKRS